LAGQGARGAVCVCVRMCVCCVVPQVVALSVHCVDLSDPPNESVKLKMKGGTATLFV